MIVVHSVFMFACFIKATLINVVSVLNCFASLDSIWVVTCVLDSHIVLFRVRNLLMNKELVNLRGQSEFVRYKYY